MKELHDRFFGALGRLPLKNMKLLVDVREAPPRNDPAFEREVTKVIGAIISKFAGHAVLVKTAVGVLQVQRLERARQADAAAVFQNEADAFKYLGL
jgi:hypothetical protein